MRWRTTIPEKSVEKEDDVFFVGETRISKQSLEIINLSRKVDALTKEKAVLAKKNRDLQKIISLEDDRRRLEKEVTQLKCVIQNNAESPVKVAGSSTFDGNATETVEKSANSNAVSTDKSLEIISNVEMVETGGESNATSTDQSSLDGINLSDLSGLRVVLDDSDVKEAFMAWTENDMKQMTQELQEFVKKY